MTRTQDLPALAKSGQAVVADPKKLLRDIHELFTSGAATGKRWPAIYYVEGMDEEKVRAMSVSGTVFEPIDEHLRASGVPADGTVGGLMDTLGLSKDDVHNLACECHSADVDSQRAAYRLNKIIHGEDQGLLEL